ncbi:PREDICTED: coagulation factor XII [Crocodylus porosus]|uniref:coagulation factor XII n=1 Tax=Crocodylus porosus TaxID=8502 RepID=UPI00093ACBB9|nr:PREDICTED: coagulation factor XII [Crocodylus porosus]
MTALPPPPLPLLLLLLLLGPGGALQARPDQPPKTKGKGAADDAGSCHFPFRYQRRIHRSCLRGGPHGPQPWCATTGNYDRDGKWAPCVDQEAATGPCASNPCHNGGSCETRGAETPAPWFGGSMEVGPGLHPPRGGKDEAAAGPCSLCISYTR